VRRTGGLETVVPRKSVPRVRIPVSPHLKLLDFNQAFHILCFPSTFQRVTPNTGSNSLTFVFSLEGDFELGLQMAVFPWVIVLMRDL